MEGYLTYYYDEHHFLYITGICTSPGSSTSSPSRSRGAALIKLQFHLGTDMPQATVAYVNRARLHAPR